MAIRASRLRLLGGGDAELDARGRWRAMRSVGDPCYSKQALTALLKAGADLDVLARVLEASVWCRGSYAADAARFMFGQATERSPGAYVMWDGRLWHPAKIGCATNPRSSAAGR